MEERETEKKNGREGKYVSKKEKEEIESGRQEIDGDEREERKNGRTEEREVHRKTLNLKEISQLNFAFLKKSSDVLFKGFKLALIVKLRSQQHAQRAFPPVD